ncbi:hypothetical protein RQP46_008189 [Phenoliferia psychrophenolica]
MSFQDDGASESGSPPELELDEAGSRCLITSLPTELLSMIHALVFSGLSLVDEQLERYHLQSVCKGFKSFFTRPNKRLIVANVDRAVALKKAIKSGNRSTPKSIRIHLAGKGSGRSDKFAALLSACDVNVLTEVTLKLGQTPLGVARARQVHDWIGLPLRRALVKVQMEVFRLLTPKKLGIPEMSVDALEELLAAWPHLSILEIGSFDLCGSRTASPTPATLQPVAAAAAPPAAAPFILPKHLIKLEVRIDSTDACTLIQNLLESSKHYLYVLHIPGSYLVGNQLEYLRDLIPAIPYATSHISCEGGDELYNSFKDISLLDTVDLWSGAVDASYTTTLAILRSVPSLKRVRLILNSSTIDFSPSDLIKYFSGVKHVSEFEFHVSKHIRKSSPLKLWDKEELDDVREVARAKKIEFTIVHM